MLRSYITKRPLANGATAFLVKEEGPETASVYAWYQGRASDDLVHEHKHIAKVPEELIQEIEERPTWIFKTSPALQEFIDKLWKIVEEKDTWYIFK